MSTTHSQKPVAMAGPGRIVQQKVRAMEIVEVTGNGEVRSIPQGIGTTYSTRRYRDCVGRELPVEHVGTSTGETLKLPAHVTSLGKAAPL